MSNVTIKNIYAGKPDAKDEIVFNGIDDFLKTLIMPTSFNIKGITTGDKFFITGLKGTGKTALIFKLDSQLREMDNSTCTSMIFFNDQYSNFKRNEISNLSRQITSSIIVGEDVLLDGEDYEYIWRWLLYNRICADNEEYNGGLFVQDENWCSFVDLINRIHAPNDKKRSIIPPKINLGLELKNETTTFKPEIEIDFKNLNKSNNLNKFIQIINDADQAFQNVKRTDIPYYIFIDELEAYYGNKDIFIRDLRMLRDLIFTVKYLNIQFSVNEMHNTKIICSIRTEILNAISRFVVTKEVNKIIGGFDAPISWNYTNTNSSNHPIMQILLRRIMISENDMDQDYIKVYEKWFPEKINNTEASNYILNNSWNKPRDIVRLIKTAQDSLQQNNYIFSQAVFDSIRKPYSQDSLEEIKEELRALYNTEELDLIINCFIGYKSIFSYQDIRERILKYYPGTILDTKTSKVLQDLYRIGFIGNYSYKTKRYRWNHKGDNDIILSPEWDIMIHRALQPALSTTTNYQHKQQKIKLEKGQILEAIVYKEIRERVIVHMASNGKTYVGSFKIKKNMFYDKECTFLKFSSGDAISVRLIDYDKKHKSWNVVVLDDDLTAGVHH